MARKITPRNVWDGAGIVTEKKYIEPFSGQTIVSAGRGLAPASGSTEERWVVVVRDSKDRDHFVNTDKRRWDDLIVGERVVAEHPINAIGR